MRDLYELNSQTINNISGCSLVTKFASKMMMKKGGSIVNISSISGLIGQSNFGIYNATKFAVRGLTKCWAIELGKYNIRVNAVCPGYIISESSDKYLKNNDLPEEHIYRKLRAQHPLRRLGEKNEVSSVVIFLASDEASFITGADIVVDGGFTIQ